jgi:putative addiction module antidote
MELKITQIGNSMGSVFPKEMLTKMNVDKGDVIHVVETPDGFLLTPYNPTVKEQLDIGLEFMKEYRTTFKVLSE